MAQEFMEAVFPENGEMLLLLIFYIVYVEAVGSFHKHPDINLNFFDFHSNANSYWVIECNFWVINQLIINN